ncbi:MAG: membrane protein [Oricola sp.]
MNAQTTPQTIGIGVLAGMATALLCLGLASGSVLAVVLFFISPVPLMIASLGFGLKSALAGAFVALAGTLAFANGMVAALVALAIVAPACASGYWLNLARPAEEIGGPADKLAWYPLADVLFAAALMAGLAYAVMGVMIGFGPDVAAALADQLAASFHRADPEIVFSAEGRNSLAAFLETWIPLVQPFFWTLTLTLSIYIALAVAQRSGLVRRPKEDWPSALRMPRPATLALVAAALAGFAPGMIGYAGSSFAGALAAGFLMAGFAMMHARLRTVPGRFALLLLAYLSVLFVAVTAIFFFIAGILGAGRHIPLTPATPSNPTPGKDD